MFSTVEYHSSTNLCGVVILKITSIQTKFIIGIIILAIVSAITYHLTREEPELPPMTVQEKKERFKSLIIPAVNKVYADLMRQYESTEKSLVKGRGGAKIKKLKAEYKVSTDDELLMALKPHPKSIAIAQAAMESSWATSRISTQANNIFGVWSFDEDEPRIAALEKRGDKTVWLRKYSSIEDSVSDYYRTMARSDAFSEFRQAKMKTSDPFVLVTKLNRYSEKGSAYGEELSAIIRSNKFDQFDEKK